MTLTQETVTTALALAQAKAAELGAHVSIAVVDAGGHLRGLSRTPGAPPLSAKVAEAKAASAALTGRDGEGLRRMQEGWPALFAQLGEIAGRPIVAGAGTRLLREALGDGEDGGDRGDAGDGGDRGTGGGEGEVLGALAVSGGAPEVDEECARAAVG